MSRPRKKAYTFLISEELDQGLKALKERDGTPESETIRRALADYLERKGVKPKARPQLVQQRSGPSRRIGLPKTD